MGRLLFLLVVIAVVVWLFTQLRRITASERSPHEELMVQCGQCGVYLPARSASRVNNEYRCDQHRS